MSTAEGTQLGTGYSYDRSFIENKELYKNPGPGQYQVDYSKMKSHNSAVINRSVLTDAERERLKKVRDNGSTLGPGSYTINYDALEP